MRGCPLLRDASEIMVLAGSDPLARLSLTNQLVTTFRGKSTEGKVMNDLYNELAPSDGSRTEASLRLHH